MLSWMMVEADHRVPDYAEARGWALMAADHGIAAAMTRLGLLYNNALGVERDAEIAAGWWLKAAALGDADGQAMLGAAYHLGAGVPKDPLAALVWLKRAKAGNSGFADRFYDAVRDSCTPEQLHAADLRAAAPLLDEAAS